LRREARKFLGYFVWKITILRKKNHIFSNCEGRRENFWGISCEKSRFYAKKILFFPIAEGGANILGVFRVKNHNFKPKNHIFSYCGGRCENFWGISCEKSRFYAKKSYFFQLRREVRKFWGISCEKSRFYAKKSYLFSIIGGCAPGAPPGSAPAVYIYGQRNW
jgi:hypothetical protein